MVFLISIKSGAEIVPNILHFARIKVFTNLLVSKWSRIFGGSFWHYFSLFIHAESCIDLKSLPNKIYIFPLHHVQVYVDVYMAFLIRHLNDLKLHLENTVHDMFFWLWNSLFISAEKRALRIHLQSWQKENKNYSEAPLSWRGGQCRTRLKIRKMHLISSASEYFIRSEGIQGTFDFHVLIFEIFDIW